MGKHIQMLCFKFNQNLIINEEFDFWGVVLGGLGIVKVGTTWDHVARHHRRLFQPKDHGTLFFKATLHFTLSPVFTLSLDKWRKLVDPGIYGIQNMLSSQCVKFNLFRNNEQFHIFIAFSCYTIIPAPLSDFTHKLPY